MWPRSRTGRKSETPALRRAFNDNYPQTDIAKYEAFLKSLAFIKSEEIANHPETEAKLRKDFRAFLIDCNMPLAAKNFDALLKEKSGDNARRNDGTVGWYHEFIPITMMLNLAVLGKKRGGFDIKDLDEHGGMETVLVTHLRHDSLEDHISAAAMKSEQEKYRDEIKAENPAYDLDKANTVIGHSLNNIDLMSQRRLFHEDGSKVIVNGKHAKEDVRTYTRRMVWHENASPIPYMCKQSDIVINAATMLGAEKFDDPEKRLHKFNSYEDMYGRRYGYTGAARDKWPAFSTAINTLDGSMGFSIYPHFRRLEIDGVYPDKVPNDDPVEIGPYMSRVVKLNLLPEGMNPNHILMKRMKDEAERAFSVTDPLQQPARAERLKNFIPCVIVPALKPYGHKFPYLSQAEVQIAAPGFSNPVVR